VNKPPKIDTQCLLLRPLAASAASAASAELPAAVAAFGRAERLASARGGWLLHLHEPMRGAQAPAGLRAAAGQAYQLLPVLLDEAGLCSYPSGDLVLRFDSAQSDGQLAEFARSFGLRMQRRSSFTQNQALFAPLDAAEADLPALLARLASASGVAAAWLDTESAYQRSP